MRRTAPPGAQRRPALLGLPRLPGFFELLELLGLFGLFGLLRVLRLPRLLGLPAHLALPGLPGLPALPALLGRPALPALLALPGLLALLASGGCARPPVASPASPVPGTPARTQLRDSAAGAPAAPASGAAAVAALMPVGAPAAATPEWAEATLKTSCQSCHSLMLVDQQRLSAAQWAGVLKKMVGWGAAISAEAVPPLAEQLAARRGPTAALPAPGLIDAAAVAEAHAPIEDGALGGGDAQVGGAIYQARCGVCHGPDARGGVGVNLADRLLLQRAPEFAAAVRSGRGLMPPQADLAEPQLANLLAWLRTRP